MGSGKRDLMCRRRARAPLPYSAVQYVPHEWFRGSQSWSWSWSCEGFWLVGLEL